MKIDVICPLYKGAEYIEQLNENITNQQNVTINKIKYILTDTNDDSEEIFKKLKAIKNPIFE